MSALARSPAFPLEQPPRKRKRFTRSSTGCRSCRLQRVKCPEGPVQADGKKVTCRRCWETDTACFYPANGRSVRNKGGDGEANWDRAAEGSCWDDLTRHRASAGSTASTGSSTGMGQTTSEWDWDTFMSNLQATPLASTTPACLPLSPVDPIVTIGEGDVDVGANAGDGAVGAGIPPETSPLALLPAARGSPFPFASSSLLHQNASAPPLDWLKALLSPPPPPVLNTFTLASLTDEETARPVVSYFEHEGCNEIVSASKAKHNWIFTQLFPRLFATLTTSPPGKDTVQGLIREWLQACLVQISYVHRGNLEPDPGKAYVWRRESDKARQRANYALLRAKVRFPEGQWRTEEYLMGFFVRCMADMLGANKLVIDETTAFELPLETASPFYPSLRDLIALYSTIDHACTPLTRDSSPSPLFVIPPEGPEWVERFVGFSRRIIMLLGKVTGLVATRWSLIQAGTDDGVAGRLLRTQAENYLNDLGDRWDWEEHVEDVGKPDRIQRGNGVMRCALQTILLCEILDTPLDDPRLSIIKHRAIELVADAEPSTLGGFQWPLTIMAIYTLDREMRQRLQDILRQSLLMSFGSGYRGTDEILGLCWEVLEAKGAYSYGIAPWRDAVTAFERTLFV